MDSDHYDQIFDAIKDREPYESRQSEWYRLRHGMGGRRNKPYPGAPNLKFKLADALIDKLKTYYVQQLYSDEVLATFVCIRGEQDIALTTAASQWFDYKIKHESNFEREIYCAIDQHLEGGEIPFKIYWDPESKRICYDACDPLHIIVPTWTKDFDDADWLVHVLHYSECQYRNNKRFRQDDDFIDRIKGKGSEQSGEQEKHQAEQMREGITCGEDDEQIVLWECYYHEGYGEDNKWKVEMVSPLIGCDEPVSPCFGLPFTHGKLPFRKLRYEITKKGHGISRGITEITAPDEQYLNKVWNNKVQWMDFTTNPAFEQTGDVPIPNAANFTRKPGSIMPRGLTMQQSPPAPAELDTEMQFARAHAEYRVQMPDLGASTHLNPSGRGPQGERVTATQINAIVGMSGQGNDLRARIFRLDLGEIFTMSWNVLCQYNMIGDGSMSDHSLTYVLNGVVKQMDLAALHQGYIITPNGSPDSWNKGQRQQTALAIYQLLLPNPFIDKGELTKWLLEHNDPRLINRLFRDPQAQNDDQNYQQQDEIVHMLNNFACKVNDSDDPKTHLATLHQFYDGRIKENNPLPPLQAGIFLQHTTAHLQQMQQRKDPAFPQVLKMLQPYLQVLQQLAAQAPQNVIPMGGQPPSAPGSLPGSASTGLAGLPPEPSTPEEKQKAGATIMQALAAAIKAGVPISHADINGSLAQMGLPPLPLPHEQIRHIVPDVAAPPTPPPQQGAQQ